MTREEAIKWLSDELMFLERPNVNKGSGLEKKIAVCRMAIDALREQEERRWISVTERLPQNYISVLVYLPGERPLPTVHEAYIGGDGEWHSSVVYGVENADVTHWMPLPEPPKEDKP